MKLIIIVLVLNVIQAIDLELIKILLTGDAQEIYNLTNPRQALLDSLGDLNKIHLTHFQQKIIWDVFKNGKEVQKLTADDLIEGIELLPLVPEDDLAHLNMNDPNIVNILGQLKTFSHRQASVITNSIKIIWNVSTINTSKYINKLNGLICGLNKDELRTISNEELENIDSNVFNNLYACSDGQLKVLYSRIRDVYGSPQSWSENQVQHIGMIILILQQNEIRALRASALKGIDFTTIIRVKPELINHFSSKQLESLNMESKMVINQATLTKSQTSKQKIEEITLLVGLLLRTYLLLVF